MCHLKLICGSTGVDGKNAVPAISHSVVILTFQSSIPSEKLHLGHGFLRAYNICMRYLMWYIEVDLYLLCLRCFFQFHTIYAWCLAVSILPDIQLSLHPIFVKSSYKGNSSNTFYRGVSFAWKSWRKYNRTKLLLYLNMPFYYFSEKVSFTLQVVCKTTYKSSKIAHKHTKAPTFSKVGSCLNI